VKKSNEEDRQNGNGQRMPMIQEEKGFFFFNFYLDKKYDF